MATLRTRKPVVDYRFSRTSCPHGTEIIVRRRFLYVFLVLACRLSLRPHLRNGLRPNGYRRHSTRRCGPRLSESVRLSATSGWRHCSNHRLGQRWKVSFPRPGGRGVHIGSGGCGLLQGYLRICAASAPANFSQRGSARKTTRAAKCRGSIQLPDRRSSENRAFLHLHSPALPPHPSPHPPH